MPKTKKKFVMPQMFDVRPVDRAGDLDMEKIQSMERVVKVASRKYFFPSDKKIGDVFYDVKSPGLADFQAFQFQKEIEKEKQIQQVNTVSHVEVGDDDLQEVKNIAVALKHRAIGTSAKIEELSEITPSAVEEFSAEEIDYFKKFADNHSDQKKKKKKKLWSKDLLKSEELRPERRKIEWKRSFLSFATASLALLLVVFALNTLGKGLKIKNIALTGGQEAYANLLNAKDSLASKNFDKASLDFGAAYDRFSEISSDVDTLGGIVVESSKFLPFTSKLSSGDHLVKSGKDISQMGIKISQTLEILNKVKNSKDNSDGQSVSFLEIFQSTDNNLKEIATLANDLEDNLNQVNVDDIPQEQRDKFIEIKKSLPEVNRSLSEFVADSRVFTDILGGNGPRKYLFLFQNNQEMRATGGFIGTYGVLDIFNGHVKNFFIDGIFNPDGQLREKVIPPSPIQKISAAWSLHDSNWFPDFPTSAEKASWFYEKTGGPTVDGVITMTPTVMQKLLGVTGSIEMPDYNVTVDKDNFIEKIQYEVEVDYDKELNQPKKILADLAPKILDKIFNTENINDTARVMQILMDSLNEKHILIYSKNYEVEKILSERGWSGEVLDTSKDYLSVINTNINGFKTDGIIDEKIAHSVEIGDDGTITDTATVTRHHNGGDTNNEWWNKVNADYMRVYVPKGSQLVSASGQTREFDSPPLDYGALGFRKDPQVAMEEDQTQIDEETGTRIYEESGKTVFANWVYVSPQETVEIKYTYILPFKIDTSLRSKPADTYSLLVQKQSGSIGSQFSSVVTYPNFYQAIWKYPNDKITGPDLADGKNTVRMEDVLTTDKFVGVAFTKK